MWLGKKEEQRGYSEINLQLSLSFQSAALGVILLCALTFHFWWGKISSIYFHLVTGEIIFVYKNEML